MTFPFVITATALGNALAVLNTQGLQLPWICNAIFYVETIFASLMTLFVLGCFVRFFFQKATALHTAKTAQAKAA